MAFLSKKNQSIQQKKYQNKNIMGIFIKVYEMRISKCISVRITTGKLTYQLDR